MNKSDIVNKIKQKKELSGISDKIVSEILLSYIKKNNINLTNLSPADLNLIIKDVRSELRKSSGMFRFSAKERFDFYPTLKSLIAKIKPKSIIDLGCGLNPVYLSSPKITYYALDINENDLSDVRKHFKRHKIKGKVFFYDLKKIKPNLPKADLCLIMKVFDVLETRGHKIAEKIIKTVNCKYFLISFSTKTLSGKPMNHPQRGWIERLLERLGFKFKTFKSKNEIFYLAQKCPGSG